MKLTIVLVNYKCDKIKLQSCLDSIKINTEVLIIDHSHDFTFENILKPKNLNIKVIKNKNLGNGAGINCGINNSNTRYVLYLDIDTILSPFFFNTLEESIKKIDNFAVIAPKINNFYKDEQIKKRGNLSYFSFNYNKIFYKIALVSQLIYCKNDLTNYKAICGQQKKVILQYHCAFKLEKRFLKKYQ